MASAVPDVAAISEKKKLAFRSYLEAAGVLDTLVRVLVTLYEDDTRPENAESYVRNLLGAPTLEEHNALKADKERLEKEVEDLRAELEGLKPAKENPSAPAA